MENFFITVSTATIGKDGYIHLVDEVNFILKKFQSQGLECTKKPLFSSGVDYTQQVFEFECSRKQALQLFAEICCSNYAVTLYKRWYDFKCKSWTLEVLLHYAEPKTPF